MLFEDIEKDNLSGAADILINAGKQWRRLIEESSHISIENLRQQGLELLSRQPGMAPLFNLVNAVLLQTAKASSGNDTAHLAVKALDDFIGQIQSAKSLLTEQAEQVLKDHRIIATTSHSSIVISVLLSHFKKGNKLEVMVGESRPMHEGRSAATKLAKAGIPITLFVDAAMSLAVQQSDLVLVGADAFSENKVVNKIGTRALALLAGEAEKPVYCLATTDKFLPSSINMPTQKQRPAEEVWADAPAGVGIQNIYFEETPMNLFSGVLTEKGLFTAEHSDNTLPEIDTWLRIKFNSIC